MGIAGQGKRICIYCLCELDSVSLVLASTRFMTYIDVRLSILSFAQPVRIPHGSQRQKYEI
jgi:hypothetical protein